MTIPDTHETAKEIFSHGDRVTVEQLSGDQSTAYVVGVAEKPAGEYEIETRNGTRTLAEYWRGYDERIDNDMPIVEVRYAEGFTLDGEPATYSETVYGYPAVAVTKGEQQ